MMFVGIGPKCAKLRKRSNGVVSRGEGGSGNIMSKGPIQLTQVIDGIWGWKAGISHGQK